MSSRYVIDTHVLIWYFMGSEYREKLGPTALQILEHAFNKCCVKIVIPDIVIFELVYLIAKNRVKLSPYFKNIEEFIKYIQGIKCGRKRVIEFRPPDDNVIRAYAKLPENLEPRDRMLLAYAKALKTKLITRDGELRERFPDLTIW